VVVATAAGSRRLSVPPPFQHRFPRVATADQCLWWCPVPSDLSVSALTAAQPVLSRHPLTDFHPQIPDFLVLASTAPTELLPIRRSKFAIGNGHAAATARPAALRGCGGVRALLTWQWRGAQRLVSSSPASPSIFRTRASSASHSACRATSPCGTSGCASSASMSFLTAAGEWVTCMQADSVAAGHYGSRRGAHGQPQRHARASSRKLSRSVPALHRPPRAEQVLDGPFSSRKSRSAANPAQCHSVAQARVQRGHVACTAANGVPGSSCQLTGLPGRVKSHNPARG